MKIAEFFRKSLPCKIYLNVVEFAIIFRRNVLLSSKIGKLNLFYFSICLLMNYKILFTNVLVLITKYWNFHTIKRSIRCILILLFISLLTRKAWEMFRCFYCFRSSWLSTQPLLISWRILDCQCVSMLMQIFFVSDFFLYEIL